MNFIDLARVSTGFTGLFGVAGAYALAVAGCSPSGPTLVVDLRTDLSPVVEFDWVEIELHRDLEAAGEPDRTASYVAATSIDDALAGARLAELRDMSSGSWLVVVRLMRGRAGALTEVVTRRVQVVMGEEPRAVTVVITRDCSGVMCPGEGDNPAHRACLGSRCVDPRCTPETLEFCPEPECTASNECSPDDGAPACAVGLCIAGACGTSLDDEACDRGLVCTPEGCRSPGPLGEPVEVTAGEYHSCVRLSSGAVECWGRNDDGQVGDGTLTQRLTPVRVVGLSDAVAIAAGDRHTCARVSSGEVLCWGRNNDGQLGLGSPLGDSLEPVPVVGISNAASVAAGAAHTCVALHSGEVLCWGHNDSGQLGDGTRTERREPALVVDISDAVALAAGGSHTCAVLRSGAVRCWGNNESGQLGDGTRTGDRPNAVDVVGLTDAVDVAANWHHTCARLGSGEIWCWGGNDVARLGDGTLGEDRLEPVRVVGISNAVQVTTGINHTCARLDTGEIRCWGARQFGQLGLGDSEAFVVAPRSVAELSDASSIAAGGFQSCGLSASQGVLCWGRNTYGELGNDSTVDSDVPVAVGLP